MMAYYIGKALERPILFVIKKQVVKPLKKLSYLFRKDSYKAEGQKSKIKFSQNTYISYVFFSSSKKA